MGGLWLGGMGSPTSFATQESVIAREEAASAKRCIRDLEYQVARLMLLNQALWELLRERLNLSDADLERKAHEVDLRDGVEDGCMTAIGLTCPTCGRVSNSRHWKCLYCGQEFEKPVMG